jgi:hypothetical protein
MVTKVISTVSEVSALEVQQSGASRPSLQPKDLRRIGNFVKAYSGKKNSATSESGTQARVDQQLGMPQVTAAEQMVAVQSSGRLQAQSALTHQKEPSRFRRIYQQRYSADSDFLKRDAKSLVDSQYSGSESLADMSKPKAPVHTPGLNPEAQHKQELTYQRKLESHQKETALRKYLLCEVSMNESFFDSESLNKLKQLKDNLYDEFGDFIDSVMQLDVLRGPSNRLPLEQRVKAYQIMHSQQNGGLDNLYEFYRALKDLIDNSKSAAAGVEKLVKIRNYNIGVLHQEKRSGQMVNRNRHYLIMNTINNLNIIIKTYSMHMKFLDICKKVSMTGVPNAAQLMDCLFGIIYSSEAGGSVNSFLKLCASVTWKSKPGSNMFLANYQNKVMLHPIFQNSYKSNQHRQMVVDILIKNLKSNTVLAVKRGGRCLKLKGL